MMASRFQEFVKLANEIQYKLDAKKYVGNDLFAPVFRGSIGMGSKLAYMVTLYNEAEVNDYDAEGLALMQSILIGLALQKVSNPQRPGQETELYRAWANTESVKEFINSYQSKLIKDKPQADIEPANRKSLQNTAQTVRNERANLLNNLSKISYLNWRNFRDLLNYQPLTDINALAQIITMIDNLIGDAKSACKWVHQMNYEEFKQYTLEQVNAMSNEETAVFNLEPLKSFYVDMKSRLEDGRTMSVSI